jgi:D-glycero-alpha-D-manno-heptose-7-phosphate kinase
MIISRTPLRVSFVGGGSDLPFHYRRHGGAVISCAIDKYVFITVNKRFDESVRVSYSRTEEVSSAHNVQHQLVRAAMLKLGVTNGIEITSIADVPSKGSGLGSSSAFTVGLLHALHAYKGAYRARQNLGCEACEVEIDICGEPIGKQDQYAAAMGGFNLIRFRQEGSVDIEPVILPPKFLDTFQSSLMMFFTGLTRSASKILQQQTEEISSSEQKTRIVCRMAEMSETFRQAVQSGDLDAVGEVLHDAWMLKTSVSDTVSNSVINEIYQRGRAAGALGGKLLGAGGGGFMLFCVPPHRRQAVRDTMQGLREVLVQLNWTGSTIIFYNP